MDAIRLHDRDLADLLDTTARCGDGCLAERADVEAVLDAVTALVPCDTACWDWYHRGPGLAAHVVVATTPAPAPTVSEIDMELSHDPDERSVVVLGRGSGTPFDGRDRLVLQLLHPHVDAALRRFTHPSPEVSPRELDVLRLVRDGLTNAQAARRLGIAEATVAKHLEHVFARTGARSRTQAVALCAALLDVS